MIATVTSWLTSLWHTMYVPSHGPFFSGEAWSNVAVVPILAVLGVLWSRTKFWPLKPLRRHLESLHAKFDAHHRDAIALKARVDQIHQGHVLHHRQLEHLAGRIEDLHAKLEPDPPDPPKPPRLRAVVKPPPAKAASTKSTTRRKAA